MKVQVNGSTYVISWKHEQYSRSNQVALCLLGETTCTVKKDGIVMNTAKAVCSAKEVSFNKETGRKVSMARAITNYRKELRKIFWTAYLGRKLFEHPENKETTNA